MQKQSSRSTTSVSAQRAERLASGKLSLAELNLPVKLLWLDGLREYVNNLLRKTRPTKSGCLEWIAAKDWNGYGSTYMFKNQWRAPRLFYFLFHGAIPKGHVICHSCDNPSCVNPDHLFSGTPKANVRDALKKGRMTGPTGEMNGQHRLTAKDVRQIVKRYVAYSHGNNMYDLAKEFGVHPVTIHDIFSGRKWRTITHYEFTKKD